ncbi:MAG: hypothetical protein ACRCT2_01730 [Plesiomonas shigelloides]
MQNDKALDLEDCGKTPEEKFKDLAKELAEFAKDCKRTDRETSAKGDLNEQPKTG